jgi:uncharacterized membrane protein YgdD (TMEM256/DUF423 family)
MSAARRFAAIGAVLGLLAVALGAFGTHALERVIPSDLVSAYETATRFQMYHALALVATGLLHDRWPRPQFAWGGWLFVAGVVIFSGSLFLLAVTGARWLGAVTPVGGACLIAGWGAMAWGALSRDR